LKANGQAIPKSMQMKWLLTELVMAKKDLDFAHRQFNEVADAAAVDEVIYRLSAAEHKFDRLLQKAKLYGLCDSDLAQLGIEVKHG